LFIVWASLRPAGTGGAVPHLDKVLHFLVYAALSFGICFAWARLPKLRVFWLCAIFGAGLEVAQGLFTAGRMASGWDGLANSAACQTLSSAQKTTPTKWPLTEAYGLDLHGFCKAKNWNGHLIDERAVYD